MNFENKFSSLLSNSYSWQVIFDNNIFTHQQIISCISYNLKQWFNNDVSFNENEYVVCVGFNSFQFFIYTLIASVLNLKIIFSSLNQLPNLLKEYNDLKIQFLISPRTISLCKLSHLPIDFNIWQYQENIIESYVDTSKQGNIVFFTSGTTGASKLVVYNEENLMRNAKLVGDYFQISSKDTCLCLFPTNFMYGFSTLMSTLFKNGTVVLERSTIPPVKIVNYIRKNITFLPILRDVLEKIYPLISVRGEYFPNLTVVNAADKIYNTQVKNVLRFCPQVWNNFGQTESGPRIAAIKISSLNELDHSSFNDVVSIGYPVHKDILIEVRDIQGNRLKQGVIGELYYKTPFGMLGYLLADGSLKRTPDWISSGDLVYESDDGKIFWAGRKSQTIKINGVFVNINLLHKEFELLNEIKHSYFVYDEKLNQTFGFFSIHKEINKNDITIKINKLFKDKFPGYPRLSKIHFIDVLPRTLTGKIDLKKLKEISNAA